MITVVQITDLHLYSDLDGPTAEANAEGSGSHRRYMYYAEF